MREQTTLSPPSVLSEAAFSMQAIEKHVSYWSVQLQVLSVGLFRGLFLTVFPQVFRLGGTCASLDFSVGGVITSSHS